MIRVAYPQICLSTGIAGLLTRAGMTIYSSFFLRPGFPGRLLAASQWPGMVYLTAHALAQKLLSRGLVPNAGN